MNLSLIALAALSAATPAASSPQWWTQDALFQQIAARLDGVRAIDNHTHLLDPGDFNPQMDSRLPLGQRSTNPAMARALTARFGVSLDGGLPAAAERAKAARESMVKRLGEHGYWLDHLDYARVDVVLVNQTFRDGTDGERLRWVPHATTLLYPLPADSLMARSPKHQSGIATIQKNLAVFLKEGGRDRAPADLSAYVRFVDETLARWRDQGAVGVKFWDAYLRTLTFEDVTEDRARQLYARGISQPLPRSEYLALQDFLARHVFLEAGKLKLAVHVHSGHGVPPFLRTQEADVRNLDAVLTDPRFFGTHFVLIHGGAPLVLDAAYLGMKPHVWIDISALPFLFPVPDVAEALRKYLLFAPQKVLFGTDAGNYPGVPVGPEVQHVATNLTAREALYLALAGLVRDDFIDLETAVAMGRGVLRENAERLYGWQPK
jgi:predicted TIM-barrel fold metal-dependent hydrolase